nr:MAG TPA: hypothetical protein [Microviridae sp.]
MLLFRNLSHSLFFTKNIYITPSPAAMSVLNKRLELKCKSL